MSEDWTPPIIHVEQVYTHPVDPQIAFGGEDGNVLLHFQNWDHIRWVVDQLVEAIVKHDTAEVGS